MSRDIINPHAALWRLTMLVQNQSSLIQVQEIGDELVVDSRLIANQLGIEHASVFKSINKYLIEIQQFGHLRFEIETVTNSVGAKNAVKFCYLNENQATLLMSLSKNTQQVIDCKIALVKAFSQAKQIIPQQSFKIRELEIHNENLKIENDNLRRRESLEMRRESNITMHGKELAAFIAGADVIHLPSQNVDRTLLVDDYGRVRSINDGIGITALAAKYGFGKGTKANNQCRMWLKSIGIEDDEWDNELTAHYTPKLPRNLLPILDEAFRKRQGDRQLKLGE